MKTDKTILEVPKDLRKGQFMFNFLEWLRNEKGISGNQNARLADSFHLSDDEWDKYLKEFLSN